MRWHLSTLWHQCSNTNTLFNYGIAVPGNERVNCGTSQKYTKMATTTTNETLPTTTTVFAADTTTMGGYITTYNPSMDASNFGVPIAICVLVIMILCLIVIISKKRRREARLRGLQHRHSMRAVSGGVAMSKTHLLYFILKFEKLEFFSIHFHHVDHHDFLK